MSKKYKEFNINVLLNLEKSEHWDWECKCDAEFVRNSYSIAEYVKKYYGISFSEWMDNNAIAWAYELNVERYATYETCVDVYKIGDRFIGVRKVGKVYDELKCFSNCNEFWAFKEFEEFKTVSYREKT